MRKLLGALRSRFRPAPELRPFDVAMPEAGQGAYFRLTFSDIGALQESFPPEPNRHWFHIMLLKLDALDTAAIHRVAEVALKAGSLDRLMRTIEVRDLVAREIDVIGRILFGKTSAQFAAEAKAEAEAEHGGA